MKITIRIKGITDLKTLEDALKSIRKEIKGIENIEVNLSSEYDKVI